MKFKALNDCILVRPTGEEDDTLKEQTTEAGIIMPALAQRVDRDKVKLITGVIESVGDGVVSGGKRVANQCQKGDIVSYAVGMFKKLILDGMEYHYLTEKNAIVVHLDATD